MKNLQAVKHAQFKTVKDEPLLLKSVQMTGDLRGAMFEAHVRQQFCNPGDTHVEVVYSFPLPWGATLLGVQAQLGDRQLSGSVIAKKQAEARYEATLSNGDTAIILEQGLDGVYVLNLGNLAPQEDCIVTIHYGQMLRFEQDSLRLLIPTVLAPRFGDLNRDGGLLPHQVPETDILSEYGFALTLNLHGELARVRVASPSHPIRVANKQAVLTVTLARESSLDHDFILVMDQFAQTSLGTVSEDYAKPGSYALAASFKPELAQTQTKTLAVKILVDCSGSMAGDSILAARRALQELLNRLYEGDTFSLSRFGTAVEHRTRSLWVATPTSLVAARRWVSELNANMGGTEMGEALSSTFNLTENQACDVLLITDGEIAAVSEVIRTAKKSGHRIFAVGIGSSPSEGLIRELSHQTGGACDFVAPGEAVEPAILRMFNRLHSPQVSQLTLQWPEGCKPEWVSSLDYAVFNGDTLHIYAQVKERPAGLLTLHGVLSGQDQALELGRVFFENSGDEASTLGNSLSRIAASAHLLECTKKTEKTNLALAYQLITPDTNFLMEHIRAEGEKATDMPALRKVAQMLPAGYGATSTVMIDYGIPSVMRNVKRSEEIEPLYAQNFAMRVSVERIKKTDHNDVPAFLRRKRDIDTEQQSLEALVGKTPLALKEWLQHNQRNTWPQNYAALLALGLPAQVVQWLQCLQGSVAQGRVTQAELVSLFAEICSNYPLPYSAGLPSLQETYLENFFKHHREMLNEGLNAAQYQLLMAFMEAFCTITVNLWPCAVLTPTEV